MIKQRDLSGRSCGPFDDSAPERLKRMGLLSPEGAPDRDSLAVAARLYAGLFYDALCDFHSDMEQVSAVCRELTERADTADPRLPFLDICAAYDALYVPIPEPIWWMSGNLELVAEFSAGFVRRLAEFQVESGVM